MEEQNMRLKIQQVDVHLKWTSCVAGVGSKHMMAQFQYMHGFLEVVKAAQI